MNQKQRATNLIPGVPHDLAIRIEQMATDRAGDIVGSLIWPIFGFAVATVDHLVPFLGFVLSAPGAVMDCRPVGGTAALAIPYHFDDSRWSEYAR